MVKIYCSFILLLCFGQAHSQQKIMIGADLSSQLISKNVYFIEDKESNFAFDDVLHSTAFQPVNKPIVNFQVSGSTFWLKFTIANRDNANKNYLEVIQPLLSVVDFYCTTGNDVYKVIAGGQRFPFTSRKYGRSANFLFDLDIKPGEEKTYFLKIRGNEQVLVPLQIITQDTLDHAISSRTLWFGIYCGIILVMVLYNFFIYLSIRDRSYLYYVLHTLFVGLTQASLLGFTYKYLWSDHPWFGNYSNFLFTSLVSIVGVQFLIEFMHLKRNAKVIFTILKVFQALYIVYIFTSVLGFYSMTYGAILATQSVIAVFILIISIYLFKLGFAEAKYYLIGWSSLMFGLIIYVSMNYGFFPYNSLTAYSLLFGSAAEVTLLSFALADKINIYKSDKEKSQEQALEALKENERIVLEQNVHLEKTVAERTHELRIVNTDLNKVLKDLKEAEGQLVESEKMAALGQLTAGIAHEINNPINFVTSNVTPLKRDVDILLEMIENIENVGLSETSQEEKIKQIEDYKEEIDFDYLKIEITHLIKGINEGALRTAEIVKGLRIFSRVDENDLKSADLNEGLNSTIIVINNLLANSIKLIKDYGNIPPTECYPGKLNQVFLNIISNAIHAIKKQHGEKPTGILKISTSCDEKSIFIKVEDNGTGMDETTKKKIFEPFFTTKDVGEGTGLGMSIAYNIIKKHNGHIHINTSPGIGTEFILDLPIIHPQ